MNGVMKRHMFERTLTIEKLLQWTYGEQLADIVAERDDGLNLIERQASGITGQRNSADGVGQCMRGLGRRRGAPANMADAHPDALRVHKTVKMLGSDVEALIIDHARTATSPSWKRSSRNQELYSAWHEGLVVLAEYFKGSPLEAHDVTGPLVGAKPWLPRDTEHSSKNMPPHP